MWEEMSYNRYGKNTNRLESEYEPEIDDENIDNQDLMSLLKIKLETEKE